MDDVPQQTGVFTVLRRFALKECLLARVMHSQFVSLDDFILNEESFLMSCQLEVYSYI